MNKQSIIEGFCDTVKCVIVILAFIAALLICGTRWTLGLQDIHPHDKISYVIMVLVIIPALVALIYVLSALATWIFLGTVLTIILGSLACIPLVRWVSKR